MYAWPQHYGIPELQMLKKWDIFFCWLRLFFRISGFEYVHYKSYMFYKSMLFSFPHMNISRRCHIFSIIKINNIFSTIRISVKQYSSKNKENACKEQVAQITYYFLKLWQSANILKIEIASEIFARLFTHTSLFVLVSGIPASFFLLTTTCKLNVRLAMNVKDESQCESIIHPPTVIIKEKASPL